MSISVVAVTGASGFIGSHVVKVLLERGYTVHACVRDAAAPKNQFLYQLQRDANNGKLELFSAELLTEGAYDAAFAAAALVISASQDPQSDMVDPSTKGTRNVLASLERCGVKHYVHTSSGAAIYSLKKQASGATLDESDWSDVPLDLIPYSYAKTEGERLVWDETNGKPFTVSTINPTMVFGACLSKPHVKASPFIFRQALYGNPFANTPMSVVAVRDVAIAHVEAMVRHSVANGKRFILDNDDHNTTANGVIMQARQLFPQYQFMLSFQEDPTVVARQWDNTRSKQLLGIDYMSTRDVILETVASMVDPGWVPVHGVPAWVPSNVSKL